VLPTSVTTSARWLELNIPGGGRPSTGISGLGEAVGAATNLPRVFSSSPT